MGIARVGSNPAHSEKKLTALIECYKVSSIGDVAQMVERSLSMREAAGSMPAISTSTFGVVVTYLPSKQVPRFRLPEGAFKLH